MKLFKRGLTITHRDVDEFVYGSSVFAAGGGGDPHLGRLMLSNELIDRKSVTLPDVERIRNDANVLALGAMGAPTVLLERFPSYAAFAKAIATQEKLSGRRINALVASEAGGVNSAVAIAVGLRLGLPTVDADGMGRAFPECQMMTFGIYGERAAPLILVDDSMNTTIVDSDDNETTEHHGRGVVDRMSGLAMATIYPMTGKALKRTAVRNSFTDALALGRAVFDARRAKRDPVQAIVDHFRHRRRDFRYASVLFSGIVDKVPLDPEHGFVFGQVEIADHDRSDRRCIVDVQNENLRVRADGRTLALVPDIIAIVDQDRGEPITTENLRFGQRVSVVGIAAPEMMRKPVALAVVGPSCFGLEDDYVEIERLA